MTVPYRSCYDGVLVGTHPEGQCVNLTRVHFSPGLRVTGL